MKRKIRIFLIFLVLVSIISNVFAVDQSSFCEDVLNLDLNLTKDYQNCEYFFDFIGNLSSNVTIVNNDVLNSSLYYKKSVLDKKFQALQDEISEFKVADAKSEDLKHKYELQKLNYTYAIELAKLGKVPVSDVEDKDSDSLEDTITKVMLANQPKQESSSINPIWFLIIGGALIFLYSQKDKFMPKQQYHVSQPSYSAFQRPSYLNVKNPFIKKEVLNDGKVSVDESKDSKGSGSVVSEL